MKRTLYFTAAGEVESAAMPVIKTAAHRKQSVDFPEHVTGYRAGQACKSGNPDCI
jgi:hypothetical protein